MAKVILLVLDSVGVGALPDADLYNDLGSNTLGNIAKAVGGLKLPHLARLGLGKITPVLGVPNDLPALGVYGRLGELSKGKDTTTGHWEMTGIITEDPLPTFSQGFPPELIQEFENRIGTKVLGNVAASGTAIIEELGPQHMKTGFPIVYTSADSVFQIAAHEEIIPLNELYRICKIAREMLTGKWAVGRVIARPFIGVPGKFIRTANRHDYSLNPPQPTVLEAIKSNGEEVVAVGKIHDIFAGQGITQSFTTKSNEDGLEKTLSTYESLASGLVFTNLVEFDSLFGHRNDPHGYGAKLEELDHYIPRLLKCVERDDGILIITADHGNDPTTPSTDHSREYVPLIVYGNKVKANYALNTRKTMADIAATLSEIFKVSYKTVGESFLPLILKDEGGENARL